MGFVICLIIFFVVIIIIVINEQKYHELEAKVLKKLGLSDWDNFKYYDDSIVVKSKQAIEKYDEIKYFKENKYKLNYANDRLKLKKKIKDVLVQFKKQNDYQQCFQYERILKKIDSVLKNVDDVYRVYIVYISNAGNKLAHKTLVISEKKLKEFENDPSLLMTKSEYNKFIKEKERVELEKKAHVYYDLINKVIDYASSNKDDLIIKGSEDKLYSIINSLYDRSINSIKKIKYSDSDEWLVVRNFIINYENDIKKIVNDNLKIKEYYNSSEFQKIKDTCEKMMSSKREFNEYIKEKVDSISNLFGKRVVREETINEDEHNYIRKYKKSITPFIAEVTKTVFESAENNPIEYLIKHFYPNTILYEEQIQKLRLLLGELSTLKEAKSIIDNYKKEFDQYIKEVPSYVMENDASGFYSRLGFATIDESVLNVEYKFSYTSGGGKAKRSFSIPMTEETIINLIETLQGKLSISAFTKEQRMLMTSKLRESIKKRDNYTCCNCGNSINEEPNLLLEIDHIIPVSKGGCTVDENLQTLCWKCNRTKGNKI